MDKLKLKIPPPVVALVFAVLMWLVATSWPGFFANISYSKAIAGVLAIAAISIDLSALVTFVRARTTISPLSPENTSALVTSGIYTYSRNPMYLGLLLLLLAWAFYLSSIIALAFTAGFVMYLNHFQICPEEAVLQTAFGTAYEEYRAQVRRWI